MGESSLSKCGPRVREKVDHATCIWALSKFLELIVSLNLSHGSPYTVSMVTEMNAPTFFFKHTN